MFFCVEATPTFALFIVNARIIVRVALAVQEKNALNHTPLSCHIGARINKNPIGNTSVPKNEVTRELAGRSRAVKKDEKHISTHPVIYESEKSFIPIMLTDKSSVSSGLTNRGATYSPINIINSKDAADKTTEPRIMRLNIAFTLSIRPAP